MGNERRNVSASEDRVYSLEKLATYLPTYERAYLRTHVSTCANLVRYQREIIGRIFASYNPFKLALHVGISRSTAFEQFPLTWLDVVNDVRRCFSLPSYV